MKILSVPLVLLSLTAVTFAPRHAQAAPAVFTIDSSQSQLTLSGNLSGGSLSEQVPGSLTTTFSGSINADVTSSTIQFTGSSLLNAQTNGVWQPGPGGSGGSAAADFGGKASVSIVTAYGALRNVVLDLTSPVLTLGDTNFDSSELVFSFATNSDATLDYNASFAGSGSKALAGLSTNSVVDGAFLVSDGATTSVAIHINTTFHLHVLSANDTLTLVGQIVATTSSSAPPPFLINSLVITNQNLVLTVQNANAQSELQASPDLTTWTPATPTVTTNGSGQTSFTVPLGGTNNFFRVKQ